MKTLFASAALAAALLAVPALAQESARLTYTDLDLSTAAGAAELDARIETAARTVCRDNRLTGTRLVDPQCLEDARAAYRERLPQEAQRAYAQGRALANAQG